MNKTVSPSFFIPLIILTFQLVFTSCDKTREKETTARDTITERIDIHLPAMYTGVLPCASCPGIDYRLFIEDSGFVEISHYRNKTPGTFEETGWWSLTGDTLIIKKPDSQDILKKFLIHDDSLTLLDRQNEQVTGDSNEKYVLERTGNQPSIREHHQNLADQGFKFFANGNEPFWSVKMDSLNHLTFETPDSTLRFEEADSSNEGSHIILKAHSESAQITLQTQRNFCQDSMSGYLFPREVTVFLHTAKRDTLSGCGLFLNG